MLFLLLLTPPLQCVVALHTLWAKCLFPIANLIHPPKQVPWIHWEWELGPEMVLSPLPAAGFGKVLSKSNMADCVSTTTSGAWSFFIVAHCGILRAWGFFGVAHCGILLFF